MAKFHRHLTLFVVLTTVALASGMPAAAGQRSPTVVELYTSQGCSSCPPADALLGKLAQRDDVIALSFHVDYWDYIGWKDPFAKASYSARQRAYARHFNRSFVYTPQMVVHGMTEASGSDERDVESRIASVASAPDVEVLLARTEAGGLKVSLPSAQQPAMASVWLAVYESAHKTKIRRGENRGREIENYNIVKQLVKIGEWRGDKLEITVPAETIRRDDIDGCAVFLQSEQTGPIFGAAAISLVNHR